jgi:Domain of unknown function (DUF4160)
MPTVLRVNGYHFHFYSNEGAEPPHIHVSIEEKEAKFWLEPLRLADNHKFPSHEIFAVGRLVAEHREKLILAYKDFHGL